MKVLKALGIQFFAILMVFVFIIGEVQAIAWPYGLVDSSANPAMSKTYYGNSDVTNLGPAVLPKLSTPGSNSCYGPSYLSWGAWTDPSGINSDPFYGDFAIPQSVVGYGSDVAGNTARKQGLYDFLRNIYDNDYRHVSEGGSAPGCAAMQRRIGAAFIVHTLLGINASAVSSPNVTAAQWSDFYARLMSSDILLSTSLNYGVRMNSAIVLGERIVGANPSDTFARDVGFYDAIVRQEPTILLTSLSTGQIHYSLKRRCGNPTSPAVGLPQFVSIRGVREATGTLTAADVSGLPIRSTVGSATTNAPAGNTFTASNIPHDTGTVVMDSGTSNYEIRYRWALCPTGGCANDTASIISVIDSSGASTANWSGWVSPSASFNYSVAALPGGRQMALHVQYRFVSAAPPPPVAVDTRKPYFRVYGGNVVTGTGCGVVYPSGDPAALPRVISWNKTSDAGGSATTHGVFSLGLNNGFASAAGRTSVPAPLKGLTFANTGTSDYGPGLDGVHIPCLMSYFDASEASVYSPGIMDLGGQASGIYSKTGTLDLSGDYGNKKITIYVEGDVRITSNITNVLSSGSVGNLGELPSLTVIARNIYIENGVSEITGTFIAQPTDAAALAEGTIFTCDLGPDLSDAGLSSYIEQNCNSQLRVHGSLIATRLKLFRTSGDYENPGAQNTETYDSGGAAERVIYSPEVWLPNSSASGVKLKREYDSFTAMPPIL
jgi:hypothetical protein